MSAEPVIRAALVIVVFMAERVQASVKSRTGLAENGGRDRNDPDAIKWRGTICSSSSSGEIKREREK